jgi:ferredoxin
MSRFGIRKKLKTLVKGDAPPPEIVRYAVIFELPDGTERTLQAEEHYSILMAADAQGMTISTGRRAGGTCPDGKCGLCRVEVLDASGVKPISTFEQQTIDDFTAGTPHEGRNREPGPPPNELTRLGCHTKIVGPGTRVRVLELFDPDSIRGSEDGL